MDDICIIDKSDTKQNIFEKYLNVALIGATKNKRHFNNVSFVIIKVENTNLKEMVFKINNKLNESKLSNYGNL